MQAPVARTSFSVEPAASGPVETIAGGCRPWRFRPHFHSGDEVVRIHAGRARLQLPAALVDVAAGDTVVVPAGVVHRFEPVDGSGWAFTSRFVPPAVREASPDHPLGARAKALLAERGTLHTDVESLARSCAVSAGHLCRAFRRMTGTGLHNFHVLLALHKAKALLRDQSPIAQAALDAGFYDQAHLNREFVRTFGMTPAAFLRGWAVAA
ncbi:MAG: helix-turn-helix transcriptional regulator [Frateuria sp.]|nr:helix-turn-helix transcriptional regulator [Frateuria sp.]